MKKSIASARHKVRRRCGPRDIAASRSHPSMDELDDADFGEAQNSVSDGIRMKKLYPRKL